MERLSWACMYSNKKILSIIACSGYRSTGLDPSQFQCFLPLDSNKSTIGKNVIEALNCSRFLDPVLNREFFNYRDTSNYDLWLSEFIEASGYKTKKSAFNGIQYCCITKSESNIEFRPMRKERGDAWSGYPEKLGLTKYAESDSCEEKIGNLVKGILSLVE